MFRIAFAVTLLAFAVAPEVRAADPVRRSPVVGVWETANAASCGAGSLFAEFTPDGRFEKWTIGGGRNVQTTATYKIDGKKIHFTGTGLSAGQNWSSTITGPVGDFLALSQGFAFSTTTYVRRSKE